MAEGGKGGKKKRMQKKVGGNEKAEEENRKGHSLLELCGKMLFGFIAQLH